MSVSPAVSSAMVSSVGSVDSLNTYKVERPFPDDPNEAPPPPVKYKSGPCAMCNVQLETGTLFVARIGLFLGLVLLLIGIIGVAMTPQIANVTSIVFDPNDNSENKGSLSDALEYSSVINLVRGFYYVIFFIVLGIGAMKRNRCICITWLILQLCLITLTIIGSFVVIITFGYAYIPIIPLLTLPIEFYFLWVVFAFVEELKVVGVIGGTPVIVDENIYTADAFTTGMYGSGTESGKFTLPDYAAQAASITSNIALAKQMQNTSGDYQ